MNARIKRHLEKYNSWLLSKGWDIPDEAIERYLHSMEFTPYSTKVQNDTIRRNLNPKKKTEAIPIPEEMKEELIDYATTINKKEKEDFNWQIIGSHSKSNNKKIEKSFTKSFLGTSKRYNKIWKGR